MMISFYLKFMGSIVLLLGLSSCGTLQSFLPSSPQADGDSVLKQELRAIDEASDRKLSRNALIRKMLANSDQRCEQYINNMRNSHEQSFSINDRAHDELDARIQSAIRLRKFDKANVETTLFSSVHVEQPSVALRAALAKTIERSRALARVQLKARLESDIAAYSVKQALMDVAAYHHGCSAVFAATKLARVTTMQMTDAKRKAALETLMQVRQKLISEGINTRSVQQKIDALILDY